MDKGISEQVKLKPIDVLIENVNIAIVDDDSSFAFMLKDYLLTTAELKAEIFSSGEDFLNKYKLKDERIIILDYNLGTGINGIEILIKIFSLNPLAKVIMVSAQDNIEIAIDTLRKGAVDYFIKTNKTVFVNILSSLMKLLEMERNKLN